MAGLTAVILAGGLGTRLRSVVPDRPKVLALVRGRPFLAHLLDRLAEHGVRHVVLCTGYLAEQVRDHFGDSYGDLRLVYSEEPSPLGTAGALRLALPLFESDPVLVMNGDSLCEIDLEAFWDWHVSRQAQGTLALVNVPDDGKRYGQVETDPDGAVLSFREKSGEGYGTWINAGAYLLGVPLISTIPTDCATSLEQDVFPAWVGRGLYGYRTEGRFLDVGTPQSYAAAEQFLHPLTRE